MLLKPDLLKISQEIGKKHLIISRNKIIRSSFVLFETYPSYPIERDQTQYFTF